MSIYLDALRKAAEAATQGPWANPATVISLLDQINAQYVTIARLEAALQSIANSPHCAYTDGPCVSDHDSGYKMGVADGHRCAANRARAALSSPDREVKG